MLALAEQWCCRGCYSPAATGTGSAGNLVALRRLQWMFAQTVWCLSNALKFL